MTDLDITGPTPSVAFGPFRLSATERLLEKDGVPQHLSSRALDILIALVERAGEVVSKQDLIARAWPNVTVDETSLRVHVAGLRKALGDGQAGARYVANIPGRGYCFVAPVTRSTEPIAASTHVVGSDQPQVLPPPLSRMIGRDEAVRTLSEVLTAKRFVTIHGPGGIGKTTVAISVGHAQLPVFHGDVRFFDLGSVSDPAVLPSAIASTLGLIVQSSDPTPNLISYLRDRRMLLILDSCEHVIEAAADLAERIFQEAPAVHILATSREALRVEGEYVYRLSALDSPPEGVELTAAQLLAFPAAHLFVERATASGDHFELTDADAPVVAQICRKLDGIALAIELAAGRVSAHGLHEIAALLDHRLELLWRGRRTALPRHQTLSATLDWSHDFLSEVERTVLRRLSIFVGTFTLEAAQAVAADDLLDGLQTIEAIGDLVGKSLISASGETSMRYRLLDTTRAYALARLADSGEADAVARQHAVYYREFLERTNAIMSVGGAVERGARAEHLGNVRGALEWCFSERGDVGLGIELAAASARLLTELSLLSECHCWAERALAALDETRRGTRHEMELQASLGHSLMFTRGNSEQAYAALTRGLELAETLGDRLNQVTVLCRLHMYHLRTGHVIQEMAAAQRLEAVAMELANPVGIAAAHCLLGVSHHLVGNQSAARVHLEAALQLPTAQRITPSHFAFFRNPRITLSRALWLQGYPDQAVESTRRATKETTASCDPVTFCMALIWGLAVFRWTGASATMEEYSERLIAHARQHSLAPYLAVGLGLQGEMQIERGEIELGILSLRDALVQVRTNRYEVYTPGFACTLAQGLAKTGRLDQALATMDETITVVGNRGGAFNMPELLRIRGELLAQAADKRNAEACFWESIALADRQSALSWRLRAATSLARLRLREGTKYGRKEAHTLLAATYGCFTEGFGTADLKAAKQLLDELNGTTAGVAGRKGAATSPAKSNSRT
jgi:predicted ATPase/DNA-binding winged helix-turn-helix (wHTH) protein